MKLFITQKFRSSIAESLLYIVSTYSDKLAIDKISSKTTETLEIISDNPLIGKVIGRIGGNHRLRRTKVVGTNFYVIHTIRNNTILVLDFVCKSRDVKSIFNRR